MERLLIFNGATEELIAVAGGNPDMMPFYSAPSTEQLNKDFTFQFSVPASHPNAVYVKEGNYAGYIDLDGNLQAFNIYKTEQVHSGETLETVAYAEHLFYELLDDVVKDLRVIDGTATDGMTKALDGSRWQVGTVAELGENDINFYYNNCLNNIREVVNTFGGELNFRLTYTAGAITGRYVDLLARRGIDTGKRFEYTKDLTEIKRTKDDSNVKTALYGRGKSAELDTGGYTRKAKFDDVIWTTPTNPVDKPSGQEWVGDDVAKALYGRANGTRHRFGIVEFSDIEDTTELLQATWDTLQKVNTPLLTYEANVLDLERVAGLSHEKVRLGDGVTVIDRELGITVTARVIEVQRDIDNPYNSVIKLGNFIPTFTDIGVALDDLKIRLNDKEGIWDNPTITDGSISDVTPTTPTNVTAYGLYESINVKWEFNSAITVAGYEVYGSQTSGFAVTAGTLLWKGKAGGCNIVVAPNQTWYFRVLAFNPSGVKSVASAQITASTAHINGTFIEDATIGNAKIGSVSADKLTAGTIDCVFIDVVNIKADNIKTGLIKSANYVVNDVGMKIDLANGSIDTKNFKVSSVGNVTVTGNIIGSTITGSTVTGSTINAINTLTVGGVGSNRGSLVLTNDYDKHSSIYANDQRGFNVDSDSIMMLANSGIGLIDLYGGAVSAHVGGWTYTFGSDGVLEVGNSIDFHADSSNIDNNARIALSGGNYDLTFYVGASASVRSGGNVIPTLDNTFVLGLGGYRWSTIYAATGSIQTSDERLKQQIETVPDAWLDAWETLGYKRFKFNDAVALKGEDARWHIGMIAQQIEQAFANIGLNAFEIGLLCYDEWDEQMQKDAQGNDVIIPAGNRYSIRADECAFMEMALMRRELQRIKETIN